MASCPACEKELPWGDAYRPAGGLGLPDKRQLDCPYCGAPLEPLRWTDLAALVGLLAVVMIARRVLGPLISDELLLVAVPLVLAYHLFTLWKGRTNRHR